MTVVAIAACAAGGVESMLEGLVRGLVDAGHTVPVVVTPTAHDWLNDVGQVKDFEAVTGLPLRVKPRLPREPGPHPAPDILVGAPMTANSMAKLALGIGDSQALTLLNENLAVKPTIVFPRVNAAHTRHPAWRGHLDALRSAGVDLVYGEDVWPLYEPREAPPDRSLPWSEILGCVESHVHV